MKLYPALAFVVCWAVAASAEPVPHVSEQIMQKGQFAKSDCKPDAKSPDYDECICEADIRYPQIAGMPDAQVQEKLNGWFKDQAAKTICVGNPITLPVPQEVSAKSHASMSVHYEITFSSPKLLAFRFTDWGYSGGAHGNGSAIGVIVDLEKGKLLGASDLFSEHNLEGANQAIYDTLVAKPEEQIFRDQLEARKGTFIKNGECEGCTLILTQDGVHVLFQTYEVAPYGAGDTDVLIPAKYISYDAVKKALATQKTATTEKK